jgi:hypothetical protein
MTKLCDIKYEIEKQLTVLMKKRGYECNKLCFIHNSCKQIIVKYYNNVLFIIDYHTFSDKEILNPQSCRWKKYKTTLLNSIKCNDNKITTDCSAGQTSDCSAGLTSDCSAGLTSDCSAGLTSDCSAGQTSDCENTWKTITDCKKICETTTESDKLNCNCNYHNNNNNKCC